MDQLENSRARVGLGRLEHFAHPLSGLGVENELWMSAENRTETENRHLLVGDLRGEIEVQFEEVLTQRSLGDGCDRSGNLVVLAANSVEVDVLNDERRDVIKGGHLAHELGIVLVDLEGTDFV